MSILAVTLSLVASVTYITTASDLSVPSSLYAPEDVPFTKPNPDLSCAYAVAFASAAFEESSLPFIIGTIFIVCSPAFKPGASALIYPVYCLISIESI